MSSDDVLERATRALRDRTGEPSIHAGHAGKTRARVLAAAASGARRRRLAATTLVPLAAVLAVSTAWADTHGWLAHLWERVEQSFVATSVVSRPRETRGASARTESSLPRASSASEIAVVPVDSLPPASASTPVPTRASIPSPTPTSPRGGPRPPMESANAIPIPMRAATASASALASASASASATAPVPASTSPDDPAPLLYAAAHRAHFIDRDPAAALRAWDDYLLAAPNGPLAPEARYNRAITLIRLGRVEDARAALTPFATGVYGTYRAREARELLAALKGD